MMYFDKYASMSRLFALNPIIKVLYFLLCTAIAMITVHNVILFALIAILCFVILSKTPISYVLFLRLLFIPLGFILFACLPFFISISTKTNMQISLNVTHYSLVLHIIMRSLACVLAMFFLILTTSISQIIGVMRKAKIPVIIIELALLVYNGIFIVYNTSETVFISQKNRLGYNSLRTRYKHFSILLSRGFILSFKRVQDQHICLESRLYTGDIQFLEPIQVTQKREWIIFSIIAFCSISLVCFTNVINLL